MYLMISCRHRVTGINYSRMIWEPVLSFRLVVYHNVQKGDEMNLNVCDNEAPGGFTLRDLMMATVVREEYWDDLQYSTTLKFVVTGIIDEKCPCAS